MLQPASTWLVSGETYTPHIQGTLFLVESEQVWGFRNMLCSKCLCCFKELLDTERPVKADKFPKENQDANHKITQMFSIRQRLWNSCCNRASKKWVESLSTKNMETFKMNFLILNII